MKAKATPTNTKTSANGRPYISARVDQASFDNCKELANSFRWSLSEMINFAMANVKRDDILKSLENGK
jgi:hypothetical protein